MFRWRKEAKENDASKLEKKQPHPNLFKKNRDMLVTGITWLNGFPNFSYAFTNTYKRHFYLQEVLFFIVTTFFQATFLADPLLNCSCHRNRYILALIAISMVRK